MLGVAEMIRLSPLVLCTWWAPSTIQLVALAQLYLAEMSLTEQQPAFIWRQQELEDPLLPSVACSSS